VVYPGSVPARSRTTLTVWGWATFIPLFLIALIAAQIGGSSMDFVAGAVMGLAALLLSVALLATRTSFGRTRLGHLASRFVKGS